MKIKDALRTLRYKKTINSYNQLFTNWGEEIDPGYILADYPRPQLKREQYTILNGYWNYCITREINRPPHYDGKILVPFSPESVLSGVNRQLMPNELLWYERPLIIQDKPIGKRCILHFGAVDQFCQVYINYVKVTEHLGGYLSFSADITDYIQEGGNLLSVKVRDVSDTSYYSRGKQKLKRGGMFYTAQSGIWQTVWMEWVPDKYIESLKITPFIDDNAIFIEIGMREACHTKQPLTESLYQVIISTEDRDIKTIISRLPDITIPMESFEYWSPERPFLYKLKIIAGEDRVESYCAMRKIEARKDETGIPRIFLNNKPYFLNGVLDQGYWPDGLYTAPSDEALIYDIVKAKELGFNMIRKHVKLEPLRWYYHCDRFGVIVMQDMVNGGESYNNLLVGYLPTIFPHIIRCIKDKHYKLFARGSLEGRLEFLKECEETVRQLYNCPCIGVWVLYNEGWGQFSSIEATGLIRENDSTRLVDHASGWYDQGAGDFNSVHTYFYRLDINVEERISIISEYGGYACYIPEHSYSDNIYGYRIYPNREEYNNAYHKLLEEEVSGLIKKGLAAAVYTQLYDVEDEVNGLFTYDRKVCKVTPDNMGKD